MCGRGPPLRTLHGCRACGPFRRGARKEDRLSRILALLLVLVRVRNHGIVWPAPLESGHARIYIIRATHVSYHSIPPSVRPFVAPRPLSSAHVMGTVLGSYPPSSCADTTHVGPENRPFAPPCRLPNGKQPRGPSHAASALTALGPPRASGGHALWDLERRPLRSHPSHCGWKTSGGK